MRWSLSSPPAGRPAALTRYGVALCVWAVAAALTWTLSPYLERVLLILFWPAVLFSAWFGGFGPALLASVLTSLFLDYHFFPPVGQLGPHDAADLAPLALFLLLSAIVSRLTGSLRESEARRAAAAREVEQTNVRLQAAAARAEEANCAKSEFLATMSHELRTPLNAIAGYVELMEMGLRGPLTDEQRTDLSRIRRSQQSLLSIINDILNFARLESGRVEYQIEAVPCARCWRGCRR